ncbi:phosphatase PAP2 family protein [Shewanella sp. KX20019]|uniref:phosphatase PAP2 family protein n=1 Tax=Shewanella sp. KX20019 TaxID=2803864 RepID=UPI0019277640|nr:phosphatase PAP2 family protein [Shewanella sp. KX20019]QQX79652.1 phosphatase PAP2 family protein [Shewanella sp. KX20019]
MTKLDLAFTQQKFSKTTQHSSPSPQHDTSFMWGLLLLVSALLLLMKESVNSAYFFKINQTGQHFSPELLASITDMGNGVVTGSILVMILCFKPAWILRVLLAAAICLVMTHLLKNYFDAPRPAALLEQFNIIGDARHSKSFPSGHTATIFLLAGTAFLSSKRLLSRIFFVSLAITVGASRIAVGAHWPIDIALGAIIGWGSIYVASLICKERLLSARYQYLILTALLLLLGTLSALSKSEFPQMPIVDNIQRLYLLSAALCLYISYQLNRRNAGSNVINQSKT